MYQSIQPLAMRLLYFVVCTSLLISCSTAKMAIDVPADNAPDYQSIKVSKVKGKSLIGTSRSIKFEQHFKGAIKEGWHVSSEYYDKTPGGIFSEESIARNFLLNFGLAINDVVSKTSDRFQVTVEDSSQSMLVLCHQFYLGKSKSYQFSEGPDLTKGDRQVSNFSATMHLIKDQAARPWKLQLEYDRETPGGVLATTLREGLPIEKGFVTNATDTIQIQPLMVKQATSARGTHAMPFPLLGGYVFKIGNRTIGWVDLFNSTVGYARNTDNTQQLIVAAASTAILLRNR